MLRIDYNIIFTIINLLLLFWLMKKFLFKPVHDILDQREKEIEQSYQDAEKASADANGLKDQYESDIKEIKTMEDKTISEAKAKANAEYNRIVEEARTKSDEIVESARLRAEAACQEEKKKAVDDIASLMKDIAGKTAAATDDKSLYDDFLSQV